MAVCENTRSANVGETGEEKHLFKLHIESMKTCVTVRPLLKTINQRVIETFNCSLPSKGKLCLSFTSPRWIFAHKGQNPSLIVQSVKSLQHLTARMLFPYTVSFLLVKRNDHIEFYRGSFLSSSHTRDLSRLTATYFSCRHFSNASPAQRLNTRPTSQSTGAFWKTASHPSLAAWWLWKFTLTF